MDRPPSSYGSMHSDDLDEDDDFGPPPPGLRLQRPDSPETAITEHTNTHQSSIRQGGLVLRPSSNREESLYGQTRLRLQRQDSPEMANTHREESLYGQTREPSIVEHSDVGTERGMDMRTERVVDVVTERGVDEEMEDEPDPQNGEAVMEEAEEQAEAAVEEDYDELAVPFIEPKGDPPAPAEGDGLHFQHTHPSLTLSHVLMAIVNSLRQLHSSDIAFYKRSLSTHCKFKKHYLAIEDLNDPLDIGDKMIEVCGLGDTLYLTIRNLQGIGRDDLASILKKMCRRALLQYDLKNAHDRRYYNLYEGRCRPGQQRYISDVYVEPVTVIRGSSEPISQENEVRRIPFTIKETRIRAADIFCPLPNNTKPIRTVMMTGIPACGMTVAVNKLIIDWKEGKKNQDFQFMFPLPAKELHIGKEKQRSFLDVISYFFADAEDIKFIEKDDCLSLFIIDALELCPHSLDFKDCPVITSAREKASFDVLLTNLIRGSLLPHARVLITSHISASYRIPTDLIDKHVELRGFSNEGKEEYFTKRTTDPELGRKVYNHMKRSKALEIICHLPLLSWMVAYVFERGFRNPNYGKHPPGITVFYSQYIVVQMNRSFEKYRGFCTDAQKWTDADKNFIEVMGKMAFRMLQDGRDSFTVDDLASVNLTYEDLCSRDGMTTEVKRSSEDLQTWIFKFVHFTLQEYMAAMYAYVAFRKNGKNVIESNKMSSWLPGSKDRPMIELYRPAIDRALAHPGGHWDMFLRFLVGLMTPGTEDHLRGYLLDHYHPKSKGTEDVVKYINKKIKDSNIHPDRRSNLELCLVELEEGKEEPRR